MEMILNSVAAIIKIPAAKQRVNVVPFRPLFKPVRGSSTSTTEKLREELSHLHSEVDSTRAKANNARLRLMRLSEAAEKLRRQAAISVHKGKEDDARDLLFQKKKVMQALEKSKSRIKLLDDLSTKLNEAIYVKESQLIGNIGMDLAMSTVDTSGPIRIVSSEQGTAEDSEETDIESKGMKLPEYQDLQTNEWEQASITNEREQEASPCSNIGSENDIFESFTGTLSYEDFLESLDKQLNAIEDELVSVLRVSTVILDGQDKQKNLRVQQIVELLDSIRLIRKRVSNFKLTNNIVK